MRQLTTTLTGPVVDWLIRPEAAIGALEAAITDESATQSKKQLPLPKKLLPTNCHRLKQQRSRTIARSPAVQQAKLVNSPLYLMVRRSCHSIGVQPLSDPGSHAAAVASPCSVC